MILRAPCRLAVPTQSLPVSPPPTVTTLRSCLWPRYGYRPGTQGQHLRGSVAGGSSSAKWTPCGRGPLHLVAQHFCTDGYTYRIIFLEVICDNGMSVPTSTPVDSVSFCLRHPHACQSRAFVGGLKSRYAETAADRLAS